MNMKVLALVAAGAVGLAVIAKKMYDPFAVGTEHTVMTGPNMKTTLVVVASDQSTVTVMNKATGTTGPKINKTEFLSMLDIQRKVAADAKWTVPTSTSGSVVW